MFRILEIIEIATVRPANMPIGIRVTLEYALDKIAERKIVVIQEMQQLVMTSKL